MTAHDFWLGVVCIVGVGAVWLVVVLVLLNVTLVPPAWFIRLTASKTPTCNRCGAAAHMLGKTADSRWWFCSCGHYWRTETTHESSAVAS